MIELSTTDPTLIRRAFSRFPSGVVALCADTETGPVGMVASSFTVGVSLDPPLVLFAVQNASSTWPALRDAERIGISVLADEHSAACRQLASRDREGRFEGLELSRTEDSDALFLRDSALALECAIYSETPAGDHHVVVLEVTSLHVATEVEPLVFHGSTFRRLMDLAAA